MFSQVLEYRKRAEKAEERENQLKLEAEKRNAGEREAREKMQAELQVDSAHQLCDVSVES